MNTRNITISILAAAVAITSAAPAFAAADPAKREQRMTRMIERNDTDGDKKISLVELNASLTKGFAIVDADKSGGITLAEIATYKDAMKAERKRAKAAGETMTRSSDFPARRLSKRFDKLDANKDGVINQEELTALADRMFKRRDRNQDGFISLEDIKS